ncbi:MAG: GNAT family N-acetyltransferase [Armatimonadota bacterium]
MAVPTKAPHTEPLECEIRAAIARDLPEIVEAWGELALHHAQLDRAFAPSPQWQAEYRAFIRGLLGRDDALAVVAIRTGRLIGYGVGRISLLPGFFERRRRGYIHDLVTRERYRNRGVGGRLVETLLAWMRGEDVTIVELTVAVRNPQAVAFWERLGFTSYMHHLKRDL